MTNNVLHMEHHPVISKKSQKVPYRWPKHFWSSVSKKRIWRPLMICVSMHLPAVPSRWTLREPLAPQEMQGNIKRAFYQQQLWVQAPFRDATTLLNAEFYGFVRRDSGLIAEILTSKPEGLPDPCTCGKCARKNGCPCRLAGMPCCMYCKCEGGDSCKNIMNIQQ